MIKKLKRKFVLIFMSITMITVAALLLFVAFSTKSSLQKDCRNTLSTYLSTRRSPHSQLDHTSILLVLRYSRGGELIQCIKNDDAFPYSDEELEQFKTDCLSRKNRYGIISDYPLAYMKRETPIETTYAFYDLTKNEQTLHDLYLSLAAGGGAALILFYVLSLFLSRWCIRPVDDAWKKQQAFVADASHELKTPLTVILANAALLKEQNSDYAPTTHKYLSYIEEEAKLMTHLVNDMLFLAKSDALREQTPPQQQLDFSELCLNAYLPFESLAYEKKQTMDCHIVPEITLNGSPEQLSQLIHILLDNACKYAAAHGQIHLSLQQKGNVACLEVSNSGAIIPKEQLTHVFERFYRVDEARTRNRGYGLGLAIAHRIVSMHQGKIKIDSSTDKGTHVRVELPL